MLDVDEKDTTSATTAASLVQQNVDIKVQLAKK
jgi:hypothetical protein